MTALEAYEYLSDLEARHCGDGADETIAGFPCLEEVLRALRPVLEKKPL